MKFFLGLALSFFAAKGLAQPASILTPVDKTLGILGVTAQDQGSIVVAANPQQAAALSARLGLEKPAERALVVVTGKAATSMATLFQSRGLAVATTGSGDQRVLVFVDDDACDLLKVLKEALGDAFNLGDDGVIIVKGGIDDVLKCLAGVLAGSVDLGIDVAHWSLQVLCCTLDGLADFARFLWVHGGCLVVKSVEGVILVVKYTALTLCEVIRCVGTDVWAVAAIAVDNAFRVVDGVLTCIGNALEVLSDIIHGGCHAGHYYVQT